MQQQCKIICIFTETILKEVSNNLYVSSTRGQCKEMGLVVVETYLLTTFCVQPVCLANLQSGHTSDQEERNSRAMSEERRISQLYQPSLSQFEVMLCSTRNPL